MMRRFYIYFFSVLVFAVLFLGVCEHLVRQVPNPYKYKEEWMESHQSEVETLILGGSHTYAGVKPELLGKRAFNLANVSQSIKYDYFLFNKFECPNLRLVIMPISYPTFIIDILENSSEWYRAIFYKIYMDYPEHSDFSRYNFEFSNMRVFQKKLYAYFNLEDNPLGYDQYGWGPNTLATKDTVNWNNGPVAAEMFTRKDWDQAILTSNKNYSMLENIADDCEKRDITLILITTPCWVDYNKHLDERQLSMMYELISKLQKQHKAIYLDYLQDNRFGPDDFYDSDHLSDVGATKFTKILNHDIQSLQNDKH